MLSDCTFLSFWECCIVCLVEVFAWHDPRTRTYQALLQDLGSGRASVACPIDMVNYMTGCLMIFFAFNQPKQAMLQPYMAYIQNGVRYSMQTDMIPSPSCFFTPIRIDSMQQCSTKPGFLAVCSFIVKCIAVTKTPNMVQYPGVS